MIHRLLWTIEQFVSFLFLFRSPKRSSSPPPAPPKVVPVKDKEYYKDEKRDKEKEEKRDKKEEKKIKKDKRDHKDKDKHKDRDREKEHKEHKNKEVKSVKEVSSFKPKDTSPSVPSAVPQVLNKVWIFSISTIEKIFFTYSANFW